MNHYKPKTFKEIDLTYPIVSNRSANGLLSHTKKSEEFSPRDTSGLTRKSGARPFGKPSPVKEIDIDNPNVINKNWKKNFSKVKDDDYDDDDDDTRSIDFQSNEHARTDARCISCSANNCPYRKITNEYICFKCRQLHPFKIITTTTCLKKYHLSQEMLAQACNKRKLRVLRGNNFSNPKGPPIEFYYEHEIQNL